MEIIENRNGNELELALAGRLDTSTSTDLEAALRDLSGVSSLIFDFAELEYLSSAGLRVLLQAQKAMNVQGKMIVRNVNEIIMDVFDVTGFTDILTIE